MNDELVAAAEHSAGGGGAGGQVQGHGATHLHKGRRGSLNAGKTSIYMFRPQASGSAGEAIRANGESLCGCEHGARGRGVRREMRSELTEREPDPNRRKNKRNAEAGREKGAKGQEAGKAGRRERGGERGKQRREAREGLDAYVQV